MQTQTNSEFIGTFAIFRLSRALADFDCGQFEQERCISWYWRTAWTWTPQGSQEEFNIRSSARERSRRIHQKAERCMGNHRSTV